jgi:hypothetical protein
MLDGLDKVPWENLSHAYGTATNIPDRIRAIVSSRGARQEAAIDEFGNDICHQGSSYSATAPCIPFICAIINNPRMPRRDQLVSLLLTIAIGLDRDMLYDGIRLTDYLARLEREAANWPASRPRPTSWGPFVCLETYFGVQRAVGGLIGRLHDKNRLVRIHTTYLLAWFPSKRRTTLPLLRTAMTSAKRWDELANSILCVGLLEWQAALKRTSHAVVHTMLGHRREEVRYAAAIYLSWHKPTDEVKDILLELSARDDYYNAPLPFDSYEWTSFAGRQLGRVWGEHVDVD